MFPGGSLWTQCGTIMRDSWPTWHVLALPLHLVQPLLLAECQPSPGFLLVKSDHVTWTLASYWLRVITWPGYWPPIGWDWLGDLETGFLLAESDYVTWILASYWMRVIMWSDQDTGFLMAESDHVIWILASYWMRVIMWPDQDTGFLMAESDHVIWILAPYWLRVITWPGYSVLASHHLTGRMYLEVFNISDHVIGFVRS